LQDANPGIYNDFDHPDMPRPNDFIYLNKPLFGYYRSDDEWVLRKHLQMLSVAGVDFLGLDATNETLFKPQAELLMRTIEDMQRAGVKVP
ncbi:hypothetical protein ABTN03_19210, partial [Acinetobacter baumannii]